MIRKILFVLGFGLLLVPSGSIFALYEEYALADGVVTEKKMTPGSSKFCR